jgi:hypothetical protein
MDLIRTHLDEHIARAARVMEAFGLGRDMLSERADELKTVLAHVNRTKPR